MLIEGKLSMKEMEREVDRPTEKETRRQAMTTDKKKKDITFNLGRRHNTRKIEFLYTQ